MPGISQDHPQQSPDRTAPAPRGMGNFIISLTFMLILIAGCGSAPPPTPVPPMATAALPTATPMPPVSVDGEIWTRTYGGDDNTVLGDILPADDGGYFIVGTTNLQFEPERQGNVYLIRTDAAGKVLYEKTYGGPGYRAGQGITRTDDGSLLIVGVARGDDTQGTDAYLLKVDSNGNELWSRIYGGPLDEFTGGIARMPDGGYALAGNIVDPNDRVADPGAAGYGGFEGRANLYLLKVDADGNELWSRVYESKDNVIASGGAFTSDGGFLALATITYFPDPNNDILLLKLDGNGDEVWSRTWTEGRTYAHDLIQTSDGNYLLTSSFAPLEGAGDLKENFLFIKFDPEGNEIWQSTFGEPDVIDYGAVLAEAAGGGYVAAGERTDDRQTWEADIILVKVDESGQLLWQQNRTAAHTMLSTVLQHPDGGFVIGGGMFQGSVFNIIVLKTDSEGRMDE